jgi:hypothetical protein
LLACAQPLHPQRVGCHGHAKPLPQPFSHACCEVGHQAPLRQEAAFFRSPLVRISVAAHVATPVHASEDGQARKQLLPFDSLPLLVSLRI